MRPASTGPSVQRPGSSGLPQRPGSQRSCRPATSRQGTPRLGLPPRLAGASEIEARRPATSRLSTPRVATQRQAADAPAAAVAHVDVANSLEACSQGRVEELQQAQLNRRGNAAVQKDLEDAMRMYDPGKERSWEQKYKFFSGQHMKKNFRTYARARHDPFNKDPSWGKGVISNVASECARQNRAPEDLFKGIDTTGDGMLNRPEMKRVIVSVLPTLSDLEVTSLFDIIDQDGSGEVNVGEFCDVVRKGGDEVADEVAKERWRNPIHRMKRIAPARVEGWDHLTGPCEYGRHDKLCEQKTKEIMGRLGPELTNNPKALRHIRNTPRYAAFGGGHDVDRFHGAEWRKYKDTMSKDGTSSIQINLDLPDPGPDVRPGFLCDPRKAISAASGFQCIRQMTSTTPAPAKFGPSLDISAEGD